MQSVGLKLMLIIYLFFSKFWYLFKKKIKKYFVVINSSSLSWKKIELYRRVSKVGRDVTRGMCSWL